MSSLPRLRAHLLSGDELSASDVCALLAMCDLYERVKRAAFLGLTYWHADEMKAVDEALKAAHALALLTDSEGEGR